ncbi:MAG: HAD-IIB family hydrolase [Acidobacteriota bacterium]|nr:HAD-IIB family hydrolase [Acidobacteriota bacterium]
MIRLIAIDIDGTLLDSRGQLPELNRRAVAAAVAQGVAVALVTGRSFHFARPVATLLDDAVTLIVNNGAITRSATGETAARRLLPRPVAHDLLVATAGYRADAAVIFDRPVARQVLYDRMDWTHANRRGYFEKNRPYLAQVPDLAETLADEPDDPIQVMFSGGVARMRELAARLEGLPAASDWTIALTEYPHRDFTLVDVLTAGCSKGTALAELAAALGVAAAEVMAVGDNLNDREMLAWAGVPVVMGNAPAELRANGWRVTGTNDEAGLARAIEGMVLGEAL